MLGNLFKRTLTAVVPHQTFTFNALRAVSTSHPLFGELDANVRSRIQKMVDSDDVVLFMKGTPTEPMCGFSRNAKKVSFNTIYRLIFNFVDS